MMSNTKSSTETYDAIMNALDDYIGSPFYNDTDFRNLLMELRVELDIRLEQYEEE